MLFTSRYICIDSLCPRFVSAIHVPKFDQSKLISGGGDPDLKVWDWMTGEIKHAIDVAEAIDPFLVVRAVKRRRGGYDDDEEDGAAEGNGSKRRKGKGRAKGKDRQEEEKESEEGPTASSSQPITENAEKVLVIQKIGSFEADGVPTIIFSAVG
jgi:tRNA (guanine-N(7)-)-methyltransferase subunit TRM82